MAASSPNTSVRWYVDPTPRTMCRTKGLIVSPPMYGVSSSRPAFRKFLRWMILIGFAGFFSGAVAFSGAAGGAGLELAGGAARATDMPINRQSPAPHSTAAQYDFRFDQNPGIDSLP